MAEKGILGVVTNYWKVTALLSFWILVGVVSAWFWINGSTESEQHMGQVFSWMIFLGVIVSGFVIFVINKLRK